MVSISCVTHRNERVQLKLNETKVVLGLLEFLLKEMKRLQKVVDKQSREVQDLRLAIAKIRAQHQRQTAKQQAESQGKLEAAEAAAKAREEELRQWGAAAAAAQGRGCGIFSTTYVPSGPHTLYLEYGHICLKSTNFSK